jgi:hypothetical protein
MVETVRSEAHCEPLIAIASDELGIHSFTESGKVTTDVRLIRVANLARALERAYDLGLLMGRARWPSGGTTRDEAVEDRRVTHNDSAL